jgi:hypothetical protein
MMTLVVIAAVLVIRKPLTGSMSAGGLPGVHAAVHARCIHG